MKIALTIFGLVNRLVTEYGFPVMACIYFHWPLAVAICIMFLLWNIISFTHIAPMVTKQMEEQKQKDIDYELENLFRIFRLEMIGTFSAEQRSELESKVRETLFRQKHPEAPDNVVAFRG